MKTAIKILFWLIIPTAIMFLWLIYDKYIKTSWYYQKKVLDMDKEFKHFLYNEFDSPAGQDDIKAGVKTYSKRGKKYIIDSGKENMSKNTILMIDKARDVIENGWNKENPSKRIIFSVNSGYRTKSRNSEVGGVSNSAHTKGFAIDIAWSKYNSLQKAEIEKVLRGVGFKRVGKANSFIHIDNDGSKPSHANWTY